VDPILVLVPPSRGLLAGSTPIGAGYPRDYTPQQMRAWSDDLARLYRTAEADRARPAGQRRLDVWRATPRDQLSPDARRVVELHDKLFVSADRGIKGSLRPDGSVELDGGRHRAHYLLERGTEPVPVWVRSSDPQQVEDFRARCHAEVARSRPELMNPDRNEQPARASGRPAVAETARQPDPAAVRHAGHLAAEGAAREPDPTVVRHAGHLAAEGAAREPDPTVVRHAGHLAVGGAAREPDPTVAQHLGAKAVELAERDPPPLDRHLTREFGEQTRERGSFKQERER
jgi:hypothetical protein